MGPGVDPHLYKASQGDTRKLTSADVVLYSGLHLEGKMEDILRKIGEQKQGCGGRRSDSEKQAYFCGEREDV